MAKPLVENDLQVICAWKDVRILEMSIQKNYIHLVCSIPPKVSISEYTGILKGKIAIKLFKIYTNLNQKPYLGNHFWSRGYFISTVSLDEDMIKYYVEYQDHH